MANTNTKISTELSSVEIHSSDPGVRRDRNREMSLAVCETPITLGWDITLQVPLTKEPGGTRAGSTVSETNGEMKVILDHVVGEAKPGQMVAIMGASGSGKTSLLNCLSRRNQRYSGKVCINGQPSDASITLISGFVQQEDLFIPTITVYEHLMFQAILRMDRNLSAGQRKEKVDEIIKALSLTKCVNTLIGGGNALIKGISGGEMKRLSFASEVLFNPSLLFADEPTSGLDAFIAEEVVREMKKIANSNRTVIATIHQPSSQVFDLFTHLILLAGSGRVAYLGPRKDSIRYFSDLGFECPTYYNPADFYIHLLAILPEERDHGESLQKAMRIMNAYDASDLATRNRAWLESGRKDAEWQGASFKTLARSNQNVTNASWLTQFVQLYKRTGLMYKRDPLLSKARFAQSLVVSLLVGLIYLRLGNTQEDVMNKMGAAFFIVINQCILGMFSVLQVFPLELPIFLREYTSGAYRTDSYFLARTMCEIPIQFVFPIIYGAITWWMVGFNDSATRFFCFLFLLIVATNASISLGYAVSAGAPNVSAALAIGPVLLFPLLIFGGLLLNVDSIPPWFYWLDVFSFFKYAYEAMNILVWKGQTLECPDSNEPCLFKNGEDVLDYLNADENNFWFDIGILAVLTVGFRMIAFIILLVRARKLSSR